MYRAVEHSPSTVVITDTEGSIEYVNPKFSELTGYTKEEEKIIEETQKVLSQPELNVVPTAVRVPTRVSHAMAVNVELNELLTVDQVIDLWQDASGVAYSKDVSTPLDVAGTDTIVTSRLRRDPTRPHAITYWVVGDNLRKGAATNSVQIAELF